MAEEGRLGMLLMLLVLHQPEQKRVFAQEWTGSPQPRGWNPRLLLLAGGHHHTGPDHLSKKSP